MRVEIVLDFVVAALMRQPSLVTTEKLSDLFGDGNYTRYSEETFIADTEDMLEDARCVLKTS